MKASFQPDHLKFGRSPVKHSNQRGLGVIGPPGVREVFDVVDRVLGLSFDRHRLVFAHVPGVLSVHHHRPIVVHHLDVDAVGSDVREFDIKGGGGGRPVVVGSHGGEGFPSLRGRGRGAHSGVVPFLAVGTRPIDVHHAGPHLFGIGIVGVGIERNRVFHLRFGSLASNLDLWCSVFNGHVEDHHGFISFLVFDRDFNGVDAIVNPRVVEHARWRSDALVVPRACAVVKRNPKLAGHLTTVLIKTPTGVDEDGVVCHSGRL